MVNIAASNTATAYNWKWAARAWNLLAAGIGDPTIKLPLTPPRCACCGDVVRADGTCPGNCSFVSELTNLARFYLAQHEP